MTEPSVVLSSVDCPYCHAAAGKACIGIRGPRRRSLHAERYVAWTKAQRTARELRPYDVEQPQPMHFVEQHGTLVHPFDEQTRQRGLTHARALAEALGRRRVR